MEHVYGSRFNFCRDQVSFSSLAFCGESILDFLDLQSLGSLTSALHISSPDSFLNVDTRRHSSLVDLFAAAYTKRARRWICLVDSPVSIPEIQEPPKVCTKPLDAPPLLFDLPFARGGVISWMEVYDESVSWTAMRQVAESEGHALVSDGELFNQLSALRAAEDSTTAAVYPRLCL